MIFESPYIQRFAARQLMLEALAEVLHHTADQLDAHAVAEKELCEAGRLTGRAVLALARMVRARDLAEEWSWRLSRRVARFEQLHQPIAMSTEAEAA